MFPMLIFTTVNIYFRTLLSIGPITAAKRGPQQGFYTFADYGSSQQPHGFGQLSQDEVVPETQPTTNVGPSTQPKQRRRHKKKQVGDTEPAVGGSSRLEKWFPEEEFQLTKARIDVSEDPIV
ncbi:hypothetical protein R6Q59_011269, partial [Mikania micrantha]